MDLDGIAARLDEIVAELDEMALASLREAADRSEGRPALDRRLTQARRAVEKAANLLRRGDGDGDEAA